jgi:hypothetical protein
VIQGISLPQLDEEPLCQFVCGALVQRLEFDSSKPFGNSPTLDNYEKTLMRMAEMRAVGQFPRSSLETGARRKTILEIEY